MNNLKTSLVSVLLLLLCMACKKDNPSAEEGNSFDINRAEEYYIYIKTVSEVQGIQHALIDLKPNKEIVLHTAQYGISGAYTIEDEANRISILFNFIKIDIENGKIVKVVSSKATIPDFKVIKKTEISIPTDKIFTGTYLKADGTIHHQKYFYRFIGQNKYEAGFDPKTTLRTETYQPIGSIGFWVIRTAGGYDRELLLYINGTLKVTYMDMEKNNTFYHGSFTELP